MLQYFEVTKKSPWLPQVKALYESAFPANERIPIKHLLDDKIKREFWAFFNKDNGENAAAPKFCGFSNSITHGSIPDTRIVVDIEVEEDSKDAEELERRNRRRDFYLRNGFDSSPVDYVWQGEHYRLLTAGGTVTEKEFRDFWKEILKNVPGAKYP